MADTCTLIVGSHGMLGRDLVKAAQSRPGRVLAVDLEELDITSKSAVDSYFEREHPSLVINAAAYTNVDGAEDDPAADLVNHIGPGNLAEACATSGSCLVHFSTDYVFNGKAKTPYTIQTPPDPVNAYGRTKLDGERAILASNAEHLIIRTSWLFAPHGNNFLLTMLRLARERDSLEVVDDQVGRPTYGPDLVATTFRLIDCGARGTFHAANEGECSWFEFSKEIFKVAGKTMHVEACNTEAFPRPAPRPAYSVLDLSVTIELVGAIQSWQGAVHDCISALGDSDALA
ncbi:MAG: dTDP-4-dehydrorhamnose reductase [Planctomycetota bacterium]|nr:dTDP-4-dehydrorhamnose reductase [Planctomycetota bacterium]